MNSNIVLQCFESVQSKDLGYHKDESEEHHPKRQKEEKPSIVIVTAGITVIALFLNVDNPNS